VELPCPIPKEDAASGGVRDMAAGGYYVCVRLVPVAGAPGCWALHILPRFVLYNALPVPLQLQQPGSGRVRTLRQVEDKWAPLAPGQRRPVHWPDTDAALRLSVRVYEPGWSWSGSIEVEHAQPGDLFVKVRKARVAAGAGVTAWQHIANLNSTAQHYKLIPEHAQDRHMHLQSNTQQQVLVQYWQQLNNTHRRQACTSNSGTQLHLQLVLQ
jgi:hypothetical protein